MTDHIEELRKRGMITSLAKVPGAKSDSIEVLRGLVAKWRDPKTAQGFSLLGAGLAHHTMKQCADELAAAIAAMGGKGEDDGCLHEWVPFNSRCTKCGEPWDNAPHQPEARACDRCRGTGDVCTGYIDGIPEMFTCDQCEGCGTVPTTPPPSAVPEADMFWPADDGERGFLSIEEAIDDACDSGAETGHTFRLACAKRLPEITVRILEGSDYEILAAAPEPGEGEP